MPPRRSSSISAPARQIESIHVLQTWRDAYGNRIHTIDVALLSFYRHVILTVRSMVHLALYTVANHVGGAPLGKEPLSHDMLGTNKYVYCHQLVNTKACKESVDIDTNPVDHCKLLCGTV